MIQNTPSMDQLLNNKWLRLTLGSLAIALLAIAIYQPWQSKVFTWDDDHMLYRNRVVLAEGMNGLKAIWSLTPETGANDFFPLTYSMLWLEWRIWGWFDAGVEQRRQTNPGYWPTYKGLQSNAQVYFIGNVLLHIVGSILVWRVLVHLGVPGAWLIAVVFATHPFSVATVSWNAERKNTLNMLFFALSMLWFVRFDNERKWHWYVLSLLMFLLALLAKTSMVLMPFVLLGIAWWRRGTINMRDVLVSLPYFIVGGLLSIVTIIFQWENAIGNDIVRPEGFFSRLAASGWCIWWYIYKTIVPLNLTLIYDRWVVNEFNPLHYVPGFAVLGVLALGWFFRKSWGRHVVLAMLFFLAMIFPVLGFFNMFFFRFAFVADHWHYLSIIGPIALIVGGVYGIVMRQAYAVRVAGVIVVLVTVSMLSYLSGVRNQLYRDGIDLWSHNAQVIDNCWGAYFHLGVAYYMQSERERVLKLDELAEKNFRLSCDQYQKAVDLYPDYVEANMNLGSCNLRFGNLPKAIEHMRRVKKMRPDLLDARLLIAQMHAELGEHQQAKQEMNELINDYGDQSRVRFSVASLLNSMQDHQGALGHLMAAQQLGAGSPREMVQLLYTIGMTYTAMGKPDEAIRYYQLTLQYDPKHGGAHANLGNQLRVKKQYQQAVSHLRQAVEMEPNHAQARILLAQTYIDMGQPQAAVEQYVHVMNTQPSFFPVYENLGSLLMQQNRMNEAHQVLQLAATRFANHAPAQHNLGFFYLTVREPEQAMRQFERTLQLDPQHVGARLLLGNVLQSTGKSRAAMIHYRQLLARDPNFTPAIRSVVSVLAADADPTLHNGPEAVRLAQHGCELTKYQDATLLDSLAMAHARNGEFTQAIDFGEKALQVARTAGKTEHVAELEQRLAGYRAGRAYRFALPETALPPASSVPPQQPLLPLFP